MYVLCIIGTLYTEKALKEDLWGIVKQSKTSPKYASKELIRERYASNSID